MQISVRCKYISSLNTVLINLFAVWSLIWDIACTEVVGDGRCVLSKCYSAALPVLDQEVDDVDPKKTAMTAKDFLLFGYYGGLVYTGEAACRIL
jgi:hypothetical protein